MKQFVAFLFALVVVTTSWSQGNRMLLPDSTHYIRFDPNYDGILAPLNEVTVKQFEKYNQLFGNDGYFYAIKTVMTFLQDLRNPVDTASRSRCMRILSSHLKFPGNDKFFKDPFSETLLRNCQNNAKKISFPLTFLEPVQAPKQDDPYGVIWEMHFQTKGKDFYWIEVVVPKEKGKDSMISNFNGFGGFRLINAN